MFGGFQVWYARVRMKKAQLWWAEPWVRGAPVQRRVHRSGSSDASGRNAVAILVNRSPLDQVQSPPVAQSADNISSVRLPTRDTAAILPRNFFTPLLLPDV